MADVVVEKKNIQTHQTKTEKKNNCRNIQHHPLKLKWGN
jgi:hypothetical protein